MIHKKDVIKHLENIALHLELKEENPFRISAFRKAAAALEADERSLSEMDDITAIKGVGKGTAGIIEEFVNNGKSTLLEELKEEVPQGLLQLLKLPGLGGKKIAKLYKELNVVDIETLKQACLDHKVQELSGFAKKTEEKILAGIEEFGQRPERLPIAYMLPLAYKIESQLNEIGAITQFSRAGSLRRVRETSKDLDFVIATSNPEEVRKKLLAFEGVKDVISNGDTKVSVTMDGEYDVNVDFRLVSQKEYATTLHHFTGSKDHNVRLRQLAKSRSEKISEYGVEDENGNLKTFQSEKEFFHHFGLPFIPPELREDGSEIEKTEHIDELVSLELVRADLHMHTTYSDGAFSIEEMVQACIKKGYQYMVITDHSQYLRVANGLTAERLHDQGKEIMSLREKYKNNITILRGIEMDILPDGRLDFEDSVLSELDFVIASIHSSFSQTEEQIMQRLKNACDNPYVSMIAHPTGRLIGKRDGYKVNMEQLIAYAKETGTILELNANPNRLDLQIEHLKMAQEAGVKIAINTDAHNLDMLEDMTVGVSYAKKAWMTQETIVNTWPLDTFLKYIQQKRSKNL